MFYSPGVYLSSLYCVDLSPLTVNGETIVLYFPLLLSNKRDHTIVGGPVGGRSPRSRDVHFQPSLFL